MVIIFIFNCYLFVVASVLGYYLEGFWSLLTRGFFEHHASTLWGPFCLIYGVAALLINWLYPKIKDRPLIIQGIIFALLMTVLEYLTHWGQEILFHTYSWDYSYQPFNIQGRVSLIMSCLWGLLALFFAHVILPLFQYGLSFLHGPLHRWLAAILAILMLINIFCTFTAIYLWTHQETYPSSYIDDKKMQLRFPNMHFE